MSPERNVVIRHVSRPGALIGPNPHRPHASAQYLERPERPRSRVGKPRGNQSSRPPRNPLKGAPWDNTPWLIGLPPAIVGIAPK